MTKVLLINPGRSSRFAVQEPLNLGFIAAYLEKHAVEVSVVDQLAGESIEDALSSFRPDIAGITSTTPLIYDAYELADSCRKKGILTVMGGVHPWIFPEEALEHADIVVRGEGEKSMLEIALGKARGPVVEAGYIENVDEIPAPARHLMRMDRYLYPKKYTPYILHLPYIKADTRIVHILTSRGCPHSECIFCHNSFKRFPYRANSPEKVIEEIKQLKRDYSVDAVYFVEDDFWADIGRVSKISELMLRENLQDTLWGASARVDQLVKTEQSVLNLAYRAGCRSLSIGFESGSPRILKVLKKSFTVEQAFSAIDKVRKAGIINHGNIIVGAPTETIEDVKLTKKFIRETKLVDPEIYIFTPYPGNSIWCGLLDEKRVEREYDWRKFNQEEVAINLSAIPTERLSRLRAGMYVSYYMTHPAAAFRFILNTLAHPVSTVDKVLHTLAPSFKSLMNKRKVDSNGKKK